MDKKTHKNLSKFLKSLKQSGVLDWVKKLQKEFSKAEVYLVGGAVRDAILGVKDNKDYDFVVKSVPMKKLEEFLNKLGWVEELGKNFGVLKFKPKRFLKNKDFEPLDIALPRSEFSLKPGGYKDFKVKFNKDLDIEEDLLRRDFTINAIAINIATPSPPLVREGELVDPFGGTGDIKKKIIRCVDGPEERLSEDYTRILRAIRLACQLDFEIENRTKKAIKKLAPRLNDKTKDGDFVSPREVIAKELLKAFLEDHLKAFDLCDKLGLFKVLVPEILKMKNCPQPENFHSEGDVWQHTRLCLEKMNSLQFKRFEKKIDKLLETKKCRADIALLARTRNKEIKESANYVNKDKLELIFGLLFHDLGKPYTIETPEKDKVERIRFYEHDNVGADMALRICKRLALSAPAGIGIDCDNLSWLVRKHMMLIHGHPSEFRSTTIEKYFFSDRFPGKNLIKLAYLDSLATIPKSGKLESDLIKALLKRIKEMKALVKRNQAREMLPPPLLNGNEIMKILKIEPGRKVGEIKEKLREKQLKGEIKNKREAKRFVRDSYFF